MIRSRSAALDALETVVRAAVVAVGAEFFRDSESDIVASDMGVVIMTDGDAGSPDITLSPLTYSWGHQVEFEIAAKGALRRNVVDVITAVFEPAIAADRTLGGAVDDARIWDAPDIKDYDKGAGTEKELTAILYVTLSYDTASGAG